MADHGVQPRRRAAGRWTRQVARPHGAARRRSRSPCTPDALGVRVTLPDGSVEQLAPGATGASRPSLSSTPASWAFIGPRSRPRPSASPRVYQPLRQPPDPSQPGRGGGLRRQPDALRGRPFRARRIEHRPGDGSRLVALGTTAPPAAGDAGTARDEFWPLLATLALVFLAAEWLIYERDGARRIGRALRGTLRSPYAEAGRPDGRLRRRR